ncbi:MAG: NAD(P)-dependent alcohol dehydrogenase [Woeseiaceae bacterium]
MKAITYSEYGPADVLQVRDVEQPLAGDDQILIRVRAAEATKADVELRRFRFAVKWFWLPLRIAFGLRKPGKQILGGYFAGEVAAIGKDVTGFSVGDEVFGTTGLGFGAYGEYVAVPASSSIVPKPRNMSFAQAAAVPLGGLNALHFLRLAQIEAGDKVLVNGAGGSIGAHAIQIARSMGADVTAVDAGIKEAFARRMGAVDFVDYRAEDFSARGKRYDVIFDMVPGSSYSACIKALEPGGRYLSGNPRLAVMIRCLFTTWLTDKTASFRFAAESREELLALKALIESGKVVSIVDKVLPMTQAVEAHTLVETEQRIGAVVIAIG